MEPAGTDDAAPRLWVRSSHSTLNTERRSSHLEKALRSQLLICCCCCCCCCCCLWCPPFRYMEHDWNQSCATPKILAECWQADDGSFAVVRVLFMSCQHRKFYAIYLSIVASLIGASAQVATNHAAQPLTLNVSVDLSPVGAGSSRSLVQLVKPMAARSVQIFPVSSVEQAAKGAVDSLW